MASDKPIELELFDNFQLSEQREILGQYTRREAITFGAIAAIVTLAIFAIWSGGTDVPPLAYTLAAAIPAAAIGFMGLYKHHGRYIEEFLPLVLAERRAPRVMRGRLPEFTGRRGGARAPHADRRARCAASAEDAAADTQLARQYAAALKRPATR